MIEQISNKKNALLVHVQDRLNEEKWTNLGFENYSVRNFVEMDSLIETATNGDFLEDLRTLCREHLKEAPRSVMALYIIGALSLQESTMDDSYLPQLIKSFLEVRKMQVVQFLCEKMLVYREHKYALRTLEQIYTDNDDQEGLFAIKKRLVLIDSSDAANAKFLGSFYEKEDIDLAMFYYRLAIERFIAMKNLKMIDSIWMKIVAMYPEDIKLLIGIAKKIREATDDEYVALLVFNSIAKPLMQDSKFKLVLPVLKFSVGLCPSEKIYRKALEDSYREIYKDHQQLEHYLKASAVGQSWKPYREAIRFFETHIAFDEGSFVFHKSWGIGQVKLIEKDRVIVSFKGKEAHEMSLQIALRGLTVLDENHILLWKENRREELKEMLETAPLQVIELMMQSNDLEEINSKELKEFFVPDFLSDKEWTKWWARAKKAMESSNIIVPSLNKRNVIELRDDQRSVVEELISRFKKTTSFDNKVTFALKFIDRGGDINAPEASSIQTYFSNLYESQTESAENKLIALLVLKLAKVEQDHDYFEDTTILSGIKNIVEVYELLDPDLQKLLLKYIQKSEIWASTYADLILRIPLGKNHNAMLLELIHHDKWETINGVFSYILNHFREKPALFIWVAKHVLEEMKDELGEALKNEEIVLRMLTLVDILNSEIGIKSSLAKNKKILVQIEDFLFKQGLLDQVIADADESTAQSLLALVSSTITLDKSQKEKYLELLKVKYPALKVDSPKDAIIKTRHPFLVTKRSYENKKRDLENVVNIQIPENSLAIGTAMEKGDLRENSEYKAALERQEQLKAILLKLEKDLSQAKIINKDEVDTSKIDVGTVVTMEEEGVGEVTYQILDQWAVNFEKGIISYHSPLGHTLLDKKVGDRVRFEFNSEVKFYKILDIGLADF